MKNRVGEKYSNNKGESFEIIEYFRAINCTIRFEDGTVCKGLQFDNIQRGSVRNPNTPSLYGIGFTSVGKYRIITHKKICDKWTRMLQRCYNESFLIRQPTYRGCTVVEEWHNFQNFAKWCDVNYIKDWVLDKDIIVKGNKIYGPDTCCFVPNEVNVLFTKRQNKRGELPIGVLKTNSNYTSTFSKDTKTTHIGTFSTPEEAFYAYKKAKEEYIKEVANKWKGKIAKNVYQAMINYKVEITD